MTDPSSTLRTAFSATAAAGPARFTLHAAYAGSRARIDALRSRNPIRRLVRLLSRRWFSSSLDVVGIVDLDRRRAMAWVGGAWGMIQDGDRVWSGRAGRELDDRLRSDATDGAIDPLGLVGSVVDVSEASVERCDDPNRYLVVSGAGQTVEVWLEDGRIRRVSRDCEGDITTLTLRTDAVDADAYDWTRLPGQETDTSPV